MMRWPHTITRLRAPLVADEYGTPASMRDWDNAVETSIAGCFVQPLSSDERTDGREASIERMQLFAPVGTSLEAADRVRFDGALYEIVGPGRVWTSVLGGTDHVEATLRRVVG